MTHRCPKCYEHR
uniref:Uncharacterized protein n=1 Tax=Arundo donax TaxID=35708 RepID=A0A0A9C0R1_ARUDO